MKLEVKNYKALDAIYMPFKIAPFLLTLQVLLVIIQAVLPTILLAFTTAGFVDTAIAILNYNQPYEKIYVPLLLLLAVVGAISIFKNLPGIVSSRLKFSLERKLKPAFIHARAGLSFCHIEDSKCWELVNRVANDPVGAIQRGAKAYLDFLRSIVSIVAILWLVAFNVWWTTLVIIAFSIPLLWLAVRAGKINYQASVATRKHVRRHEYYHDMLINRDAVEERTLFNYGEEITKRFTQQYEIARLSLLKVNARQWLVVKGASIATSLVAILISITLINPVITGTMSPGMFMGIVITVFNMVNILGWTLQDATENISSINGYMNDLSAFASLSKTEGAHDLPSCDNVEFNSLEFSNVRFRYPTGEHYVLDNLSFKIKKGQHYAFVGLNGAGKTTIIKLLTGLYPDYEGQIFINSKELREYPLQTLKTLFSVVYQDFARYQIHLGDNIALGNCANENDKDSVYDALRLAGLDDVVSQLSDGINTPLGKISENGVDISGGQWQKVAIARSIVSPAPIKIFDEPTASLDPISESLIYNDFEKLMQGKTTIFISHRLGSTKLADEILVIHGGNIIEKGTHSELMELNGKYCEMFNSQRRWYG